MKTTTEKINKKSHPSPFFKLSLKSPSIMCIEMAVLTSILIGLLFSLYNCWCTLDLSAQKRRGGRKESERVFSLLFPRKEKQKHLTDLRLLDGPVLKEYGRAVVFALGNAFETPWGEKLLDGWVIWSEETVGKGLCCHLPTPSLCFQLSLPKGASTACSDLLPGQIKLTVRRQMK